MSGSLLEARLCVSGYGVHQELCIIAAAEQDWVLIRQAHHAQRTHVVAVRPLGLRVHPALRLSCKAASARRREIYLMYSWAACIREE